MILIHSFYIPGDYMLPDAEPEDRVYTEIFSIDDFYKVAEQCLEEYNNTHKNRMNLVIFRYVLEHLSRMCRILRSPGKKQQLSAHYCCSHIVESLLCGLRL